MFQLCSVPIPLLTRSILPCPASSARKSRAPPPDMAKFKVPSWLTMPSNPKKNSRRSFFGFSPFRTKPEPLPAPSSLPPSRIIELAATIAAETEKLDAYLRDNGLPEPAFTPDVPDCLQQLPPHMQICRREIVHATKELESLARGPKEIMRWTSWNVGRVLPRCGPDADSGLAVSRHVKPSNYQQLRHR